MREEFREIKKKKIAEMVDNKMNKV